MNAEAAVAEHQYPHAAALLGIRDDNNLCFIILTVCIFYPLYILLGFYTTFINTYN
jgi:hypothetical protein